MTGFILFDIDGTLLKTGDIAHQQALVEAIERIVGVPASLDGIPLGGMLDSQIVRLALEREGLTAGELRESLPEIMHEMGTRYRELIDGQDRRAWLLPGVERLAEKLTAWYQLGVLTGNAGPVARAKLESAGVQHFFPVGAYGDSAEHRYQLVEVAIEQAEQEHGRRYGAEETIIVGDTPKDIEAARESGALMLAVATGRYSMKDLGDHSPDALLPDLGDVDAAVELLRRLLAARH